MAQMMPRAGGQQGAGVDHFFLARSAASRAAMFRAAVTRWMTLMTDLSRAMGAVIQSPIRKSPTEPTVGRQRQRPVAWDGGAGARDRGLFLPRQCRVKPHPHPLFLPSGPSEKLNRYRRQ